MSSRSLRASFFALVAGLVSLAGCAEGPLCEELGSCGGTLVGTWAQRPFSEGLGQYCQEPVHAPPPEEHLIDQPIPVAREPVPERTHADWCYSLVLTSDQNDALRTNLYWSENLPYSGGLVTYEANGEYTIDFGRDGRVSRYYSRTCLTQYGHAEDCALFQQRLYEANEGAGEYDFFECAPDLQKGGCQCSFSIGEATAQAGVYSVSGSTVTHFSSAPTMHFNQAVFCVNGDTLEISGANNSYLWGLTGLRTLDLVKVNCSDGLQGPGEDGVDCGLSCPTPCQ